MSAECHGEPGGRDELRLALYLYILDRGCQAVAMPLHAEPPHQLGLFYNVGFFFLIFLFLFL